MRPTTNCNKVAPERTHEPHNAQTASSPGTEQFGINLVANTSPTTFDFESVQVPDATYGFGPSSYWLPNDKLI